MQTCFIYAADIYCRDCGQSIADDLRAESVVDYHDSDTFPQESTIGESDTPTHCGACGCFLENPLTLDGLAYVQRALDENTGAADVLRQWARRYGFHNARVLHT